MKARKYFVIYLWALTSVFLLYPACLFAEGYTITATAEPEGAITPSGEIKVQEGESITFSFLSSDVYYWIDDIIVDGVSVGAQNEYTFENITSDHTIHAIFVHGDLPVHTITSSCGEYGMIDPSGSIMVMNGENQNFIITPDSGYDIDTLEIDGVAISLDDYWKDDHYEYEFGNVSANHTIHATVKEWSGNFHTITTLAGEHGYIYPPNPQSVKQGWGFDVYITPHDGYEIDQILIDGIPAEVTDEIYSFRNVTEDHHIEVTFKEWKGNIYTITPIVIAGEGSIYSGIQKVKEGASISVSITPATDYVIDRILIDDMLLSSVQNSYTFENVTADHTIKVLFRKAIYTITSTSGEHGSVIPSEITANKGSNATFLIVPDDRYVFDFLIVDGTYTPTPWNSSYFYFENVNANHVIHAVFKPEPLKVITVSPEHGENCVPIDTHITATFSEEVDPSTINTETFFLKTGTEYDYTIVPGTVTCDGTTATFTPAYALDYGKYYMATITPEAKSLSGNSLGYDYNWSFYARPKEILSISPNNHENIVDVNMPIRITFADPIDPLSINQDTFFVTTGMDYNLRIIDGSITYDDTIATFTPDLPLVYTFYTVTVTTGVKRENGDKLLSDDYQWSFMLRPDFTQVIRTFPKNSETDVPINAVIMDVTSDNLNCLTVSQETFMLKETLNNIEVKGIVQCDGYVAGFIPDSPLDDETSYTAVMTAGVKNNSGEPLEDDYTWEFTTVGKEGIGTCLWISSGTSVKSVNNDTAYSLPFSVMVADQNGNPVPNAEVVLGIFPNQYATGYWNEDGETEGREEFSNEDTNRNLILDFGEDTNGDGELTPPISAVGTLPFSVITDEKGLANADLVYPKSSAAWINAEVTAKALISGAERQTTYYLWLPYLEEDTGFLPHSPYVGPMPEGPPTLIEKNLTQTNLSLGFSQPIDPSTLNTGTFLVKAHIPGIGYGTISGTIRCSGPTVIFTPYSDLRPELSYSMTMTTGVKDLNGNPLEADYTENFTLSDISAAEAQYQTALDDNVAELGAPGGILYVDDSKYGKFYLATGISDWETQTPMNPTDRFRIASITKTFTAACMLLLAEDGFLSLDDPIHQYVPDLEIPFDDLITIRQLLNHTSGIADYLDTGYVFSTMLQDQSHVFQPEELVQIALTISPDLLSDPGTEFYYSNTNYVILGLIIETVTGKNYGDVIRTRLIDPLGLTHTFVPNDETIPGSYAHGYMRYAGQIADVTFLHPSVAWAAGNMISTAGDLGRWAKALYGGEVLSHASLTEMLTYVDDPENPDMKYGLGVMYDLERNVIGHTGGIPGYVCAMYYDPETGDVKVFAANLSDEDNSERAAIRFVPAGVRSFTLSPA